MEKNDLLLETKLISQYFNLTNSLYLALDKDGKVILANNSLCDLLEIKNKEILGKNWLEEFVPNYEKIILKKRLIQLKNSSSKNNTSENDIITKHNEIRTILWKNSIIEEDGKIIAIISSGEDITEKRKQQNDILVQKEFLKTIIDENPNIIIVKDFDGNFVLANKALAKLYNTNTEEMIGKSDADYNPNKEQVEFYLRDVQEIMRSGETTLVFEESTDANTGETRYYQSIKKPIYDQYGNKQILIIANDITDIKRTQKKLKENEEMLHHQSKMAAMGEMLENIAHQWRQPLSLITTSASSMKFQKEFGELDDNTLFESVDAIVNSAKYLSQTIDDFRDFFRPNKEKVEFTIKEAIQKTLNLISSKLKNREIEIIQEIEDLKVLGFENELIQVIMNIINNAKDALENIEEDKHIFINVHKKETNVEICIKDSAGGIDVGIIGKIFDPYFTTKHQSQGTGIGLYMSEEIISKHMGGSIQVVNEEYKYKGKDFKGACFKISLPLNFEDII